MPDPAARDPHTPIFDPQGTLWFTLQNSNMVGRLVPSTGEVKLATMPTARSQPYGIAINSKGVPFFTQLTGHSIGSIDPVTMEVREYPLPAGAGPRRLAITPDDIVWYTDYARGKLGRLDPTTGATSEWPSPGGPLSQGYAIASAGTVVWYVEGNSKPNMLVRFDTVAGRFQTCRCRQARAWCATWWPHPTARSGWRRAKSTC